jgi:hypothetical protein
LLDALLERALAGGVLRRGRAVSARRGAARRGATMTRIAAAAAAASPH